MATSTGEACELGLSVDRETNLVAVAQYHLNERRNRSRINQKIIDEFIAGHSLNDNHKILARLPISTYWTTNYDRMIETALEAAGKVVDVKHSVAQLRTTVKGRQALVFKMHGDAGDPDHAVLTKDDYEGYFRDREPFVTALSGDLVSKTILFVGFSFSDPNIDYVMSRVRVVLRHQPKQHYCILRRESRKPREKLADFEYRQRQQNYFVKDLARTGVHALMVSDYADITRILSAIEARYRTQTVFISGSAYEFAPWKPDDAGRFIEALGSTLVSKKLNVVTGFGLGVGPSVIAGALQKILVDPKRHFPSQLQAHPFPVDRASTASGHALHRPLREAMIEKAGIAIFLFGNKRDGRGKVVPATGMEEELQIAQSKGLHIIAVGATGWTAERIASSLAPSLAGRSKAFRKAFAVANDPKASADAILKAVMLMVGEFRDL